MIDVSTGLRCNIASPASQSAGARRSVESVNSRGNSALYFSCTEIIILYNAELEWRSLHCKKYPYIRGYFVSSFPYFNGPGCNVGPRFVIPSIYGYERIRNRVRYNIENSSQI